MNNPHSKQFAEEFIQHQGQIYRFILTLVPNHADAEELFQQTAITLWEKWQDYNPDSPFIYWAFGIARNHIRNFIRKQSRHGKHVIFNEQLVEQIADVQCEYSDELEQRRKALHECLDKLPPKHRKVVSAYYDANMTAEAVALDAGVSRRTLFRVLQRIREVLLDCVTRTLKISETGS